MGRAKVVQKKSPVVIYENEPMYSLFQAIFTSIRTILVGIAWEGLYC